MSEDRVTDEKPTLAEIIAKLKEFVVECEKDDEERKLQFGYFETSEGNL